MDIKNDKKIIQTYKLSEDNFHKEETLKYQIILGHTGRNSEIEGKPDLSFFNSWRHRRNGKSKDNSMFSIDTFGNIYQHFDPKYYSDYIDNSDVNKNIISISLLNEGLLELSIINKCYHNWENKKYNRDDKVVYKFWRNNEYWAPYSNEQYESLNYLLNKLCLEHKIEKRTINHNTIVDNIENYEGIATRANHSLNYLDLSPAFDWNRLDFQS